jgi:hypothetical protein
MVESVPSYKRNETADNDIKLSGEMMADISKDKPQTGPNMSISAISAA